MRLLCSIFLFSAASFAQNPATWTLVPLTQPVAPGSTVPLRLQLKLQAPWHMYSLSTPKPGPTGGPIATTISLAEQPGIASSKLYVPKPARKFDPNFNIDTETYGGELQFLFAVELAANVPPGPLELTSQMRYQLCTESQCLPPKKVTASATITVSTSAAAMINLDIPAGMSEFVKDAPTQATPGTASTQPASTGDAATAQGLGSFLLIAFGFGLAAIFTPCVFPMIPITMSFFLNQESKSRGATVAQAVIFCISIITLFTAIGLGLTAALGPFAVVQLGSNPWVNGVIALVFFVFGLSLLGAFEITLPSWLLTRLNEKSNQGGYAGTIFMGLTFCLASFACVGPFMGTLLAASVGGDKLQPALGMMAFAAALSLPFFLLALFPSFLKKLPRSGGWMSRVKIVLGFLVMAAMLKYLSNIDQVLQWNLLTRERFLGAWFVLFALPGLYLLGFLAMEGIKRDEQVGAGRLLLASLFLAFAVSLLPGLFGGRLGELDAYVPAATEGTGLGGAVAASGPKWIKNDFAAALAQAKQENKQILVAFTGYACTNCHWMKANMFTRSEVAAAMKDFVLVELYTDGTDAASEANQKRQEELFKTVAIPFYAIFDSDEKVVGSFAGLTKDPPTFLSFLTR